MLICQAARIVQGKIVTVRPPQCIDTGHLIMEEAWHKNDILKSILRQVFNPARIPHGVEAFFH